MASFKEDDPENLQQMIEATDRATIEGVTQALVSRPTGNIHIGPTYAHSKQEEFNDYFAHAIAVYKGRLYQAVAQLSYPSSPYKLLRSFSIEDELIFCGRTNVIETLCKKVFQDRLLVIHAKSGAGKTSLLNAGLSPYMIRHGSLPLYIHTYDKDPLWVIKQALLPATLGSWPDGLRDLSLREFLAYVCDYLKRDNIKELIIILDQFEDFFLDCTQPPERLSFIQALGDCYEDQTLPIRIIISLRKDYYSDLTEFEQVLPHLQIFQNQYCPRAMTPQEVKEAIVKPLNALNGTVTYDPTLLDTLITDLSRSEIILPLLQITCTRLYETLGKDKKRITLKMYEALGKAEGVLQSYLNEVLADLPEKEKVLAKNILKEFVRSDKTKQMLSYRALIARSEVQRNELDRVLARLVNARLLCRDDIEGETRYEVVHDYLTTEITKWIDNADQEFKRAEELLRSELANWRSYHHLIFIERLKLLYPYRERFKGLDAEDWECLLRSVIEAEDSIVDKYPEADVTNWVKVVSGSDISLLSKAIVEPLIAQLLNPEDCLVRSAAARGLGMIAEDIEIHCAVEPLIAALQDKDYFVCEWAAWALGNTRDVRAFEPLISAIQNGNLEAAEALGTLGDVRAVEALIATLQDKDSSMHAGAALGLGTLKDVRAVEALIATLQDKNRFARRDVAIALGEIGDTRAEESLIISLQDEDSDVREAAKWALDNIRAFKSNVSLQNSKHGIQDE